jgi:predicted permease
MRRRRALDGLDDDIRDFIARETEDNIARGMSADDARRQAMLTFGNIALVKEDTRSIWVRLWAEQLLQDLRYALRTIRRNPRFAAVIVLTLAVAIGMNTAIFSVFNAVVLRPIGYPHPERLVWLSTVGVEREAGLVTGPDFVDWREQARSFDRMVAYFNADSTLVAPNGATRVRAAMVTEDFWDLSGAVPAAGRLPRPSERDVVLLSHELARSWFAGDANLIGRTVALSGRQATIVGVLPEQFRFQFPGGAGSGLRQTGIDLYQPLHVSGARGGPMQLLSVVARLAAGATLQGAHSEIDALRTRSAQAHPNPLDNERTLRVVPLHQQLIGGADRALLVLLGAASFVLVIACANAANLLLARTSTRHKEIAVRMAVGAGRGRVIRQLLVETLVLAAAGGVSGLLLARMAVAALLAMDAQAIPRLVETSIDGRVLGVVFGICVVTMMLAGLAPALALWRLDPYEALNGKGVSAGIRSVRSRRLVVAGEVALALVLLIGAGLMLKSAWRLNAYPQGFAPQHILTARIELSGDEYAQPHRQAAFASALLERLHSEPGVDAASISTHGYSLTAGLAVEGEAAPALAELARKPPIFINATSASLKSVLGLELVRGRWFADAEHAVVVNESLLRRDFADRDPIGRRIRLSRNGPALTIVGIVADLRYSGLDQPVEPEVYVPYASVADGLLDFSVLVRATRDPSALAPAVRRIVADIDRAQTPVEMSTLEQTLVEAIAPRRLNLALFATFAAAAMFLAVVGIYGVMAYSVAQRAHEIGVRLALGARQSDVVRMVVGQGMRVTLAGVTAGVAAALLLTRFMESLLFEVDPADPSTFALLTAVLVLTGLLACCGPAVRAALVDPVDTLRSE